MAASPLPSGGRTANVRRTSQTKRRHQHLLDTGVRSSEADRQRKRWWLGMTAKLFIAAAISAGAYVGITKLVARAILQNSHYNISELNVETDGALNPADILEAADLHKGTNIFHVDLARAQARVAAIPQVEKVLVSRQLPNRVAIQVSERRPVAWLAPANSALTREEVTASKLSWLVDAGGVALRPKKLNSQDRFLPIIRNYAGGSLAEGQEAAGEEIKSTLDLLRAQQESTNTWRFQIEEIDLAKHFGLVVTDRNGLQVLFGLDEMDRQLKRLDVYLQAMDQRGQKAQSINLLVERNVPVTYAVNAVTTDKPAVASVVAEPSPAPGATAATTKDKEKSKGRERERAKGQGKANEKSRVKLHASESVHAKASAPKGQPFLNRPSNAPKALPVNASH